MIKFRFAARSKGRRILTYTLILYYTGTKALLESRIKTYKRKLDRELGHIKLILAHQRHQMPVGEWLKLVDDTKQSIIANPHDFLPGGVPPGLLFHAAIEKVFDGFLEDQRLLALQTSPGFKISRKDHS